MPTRLLIAIFAAFFAASPAAAWWDYGHATVAEIAMSSVRPATRTKVRHLLKYSRELDTPDCPAATIEQASIWADCVRDDERFKATAPWHYQNLNVCRPFDRQSACADGNCVSAQISMQAERLADGKLKPRERLRALLFLMHFVGDLHQPMHSGDRADRGGNRVRANYGLIGGRTNLHSIWDGYFAERAISTPPAGARGLLMEHGSSERRELAGGTVDDWSRESWQVSRDLSYTGLFGEPCGPLPLGRPVLREDGVRAAIPAVRRQIVAGGLRLARLLDQAFSPGAGQR